MVKSLDSSASEVFDFNNKGNSINFKWKINFIQMQKFNFSSPEPNLHKICITRETKNLWFFSQLVHILIWICECDFMK